MPAYDWKKDSRFKADPDAAGRIMEELAARNGLVKPDAVVQVAEPVDNVLHDDFEWDDAKAGHLWRRDTAGNMIRALVVIQDVTPADPDPQPIRLLHNVVTEDGERGYATLIRVTSEAELFDQVVADIVQGIRQYRDKLMAFHQHGKAQEALRILEELLVQLK